jgi:hypothetical protein
MNQSDLKKISDYLMKSRDYEIADVHQDLKYDSILRAVKKVTEHALKLSKSKRVVIISFVV